jgi:RNA recognition motif-containing protein
MSRLDDTGEAKSRGVGFVEFDEHEHALACLRQLNNNPSVVTALRRPIVEFAIENVKILKSRERKLRQHSEWRAQQAQAEGVLLVATVTSSCPSCQHRSQECSRSHAVSRCGQRYAERTDGCARMQRKGMV